MQHKTKKKIKPKKEFNNQVIYCADLRPQIRGKPVAQIAKWFQTHLTEMITPGKDPGQHEDDCLRQLEELLLAIRIEEG